MSEQYKPGDVVKGQVLTQSGQWVPVSSLYSVDAARPGSTGGSSGGNLRGPSLGKKWLMGFVWIVLAGWMGAGTAAGVVLFAIGRVVGGLPAGAEWISSVVGVALGIWWHVSWLAREAAPTRR